MLIWHLIIGTLLWSNDPAGYEWAMGLNDALEYALEHNLDIQLERISVVSQNLSLEQVGAVFEPTISAMVNKDNEDNEATSGIEGDSGDAFTSKLANVNLAWEKREFFGLDWNIRFNNQSFDRGDISSLGEVFTSTISFSAEQELLRGFSFQKEILKYDEFRVRGERTMSEMALSVAINDLIREVESAYWNLVIARENKAVRDQNLKLARELMTIYRSKVEAGAMAKVDLLLAEGVVAQREVELIQAEDGVFEAEEMLKRLMNLQDWGRTLRPTDPLDVARVQPNFDRDVSEALSLRAELKRDQVAVDNAHLLTKVMKSELKPSLRLMGAYQGEGVSAPSEFSESSIEDALREARDLDLPGWEVRLSLSWAPFNKQAKLNLAQAEVALNVQAVTLERTRQQIIQNVKSSCRQVDSRWRALQASLKSVEIQRKAQDAEIARFKRGHSTIFQVTEMQNNLAQAEAEYNRMKMSYLNGVLDYYRAKGTLATMRNINLN